MRAKQTGELEKTGSTAGRKPRRLKALPDLPANVLAFPVWFQSETPPPGGEGGHRSPRSNWNTGSGPDNFSPKGPDDAARVARALGQALTSGARFPEFCVDVETLYSIFLSRIAEAALTRLAEHARTDGNREVASKLLRELRKKGPPEKIEKREAGNFPGLREMEDLPNGIAVFPSKLETSERLLGVNANRAARSADEPALTPAQVPRAVSESVDAILESNDVKATGRAAEASLNALCTWAAATSDKQPVRLLQHLRRIGKGKPRKMEAFHEQ